MARGQVLLPDRITVVVSVRKNSQSTEVYDAVMAKSGVSIDVAKYFALFEIVEFGFERKLLSSEFPYNLYIQNYRYVPFTTKRAYTMLRRLHM